MTTHPAMIRVRRFLSARSARRTASARSVIPRHLWRDCGVEGDAACGGASAAPRHPHPFWR
jgi:hypothetical protein